MIEREEARQLWRPVLRKEIAAGLILDIRAMILPTRNHFECIRQGINLLERIIQTEACSHKTGYSMVIFVLDRRLTAPSPVPPANQALQGRQ